MQNKNTSAEICAWEMKTITLVYIKNKESADTEQLKWEVADRINATLYLTGWMLTSTTSALWPLCR